MGDLASVREVMEEVSANEQEGERNHWSHLGWNLSREQALNRQKGKEHSPEFCRFNWRQKSGACPAYTHLICSLFCSLRQEDLDKRSTHVP
jgi:hypothetical protein